MAQIITFLKPIYRFFFPNTGQYFKKEFSGYESILDLGSGPGSGCGSPIQYCDASFKVGVELFEPYLEQSQKKGLHNKYIKEDIRRVDFPPKSFDLVMMIDVLEHLSKEDGQRLLKKMGKWAKKKVVVFTPNGYVFQGTYDENPLQAHRSGWSAEELREMGFKVYGANGLKGIRGHYAAIKYKPAFLWKIISDLTQKIVYYCPELAFDLLAVKMFK